MPSTLATTAYCVWLHLCLSIVETSSNLAIIDIGEGKAAIKILARSSHEYYKEYLATMMESCFYMAGMKVEFSGSYMAAGIQTQRATSGACTEGLQRAERRRTARYRLFMQVWSAHHPEQISSPRCGIIRSYPCSALTQPMSVARLVA